MPPIFEEKQEVIMITWHMLIGGKIVGERRK
jgi:hypothetical protein